MRFSSIFRAVKGAQLNKMIILCLLLWSMLMIFLGFSSTQSPISDKLLHFLCFGVFSTLVFFSFRTTASPAIAYMIILIFVSLACIVSEFLQYLLAPSRNFEVMDIMFNFLGSYVFLIISFLVDFFVLQPRSRREIDIQLINHFWDSQEPQSGSQGGIFTRSSSDYILQDLLETSHDDTNQDRLQN